MDVFARTRVFEPLHQKGFELNPLSSIPTNTLTMNASIIRSILVYPGYYTEVATSATTNEPFRVERDHKHYVHDFLKQMRALDRQNMSLQMIWNRWWYNEHDANAAWEGWEEDVLDLLGEEWNSKFRKVQIFLNYDTKIDGGSRR